METLKRILLVEDDCKDIIPTLAVKQSCAFSSPSINRPGLGCRERAADPIKLPEHVSIYIGGQ